MRFLKSSYAYWLEKRVTKMQNEIASGNSALAKAKKAIQIFVGESESKLFFQDAPATKLNLDLTAVS